MSTSMMNERMMTRYECLMQEYVAGTLDAAQDLILRAHVSLSPEAAARALSCEELVSAMIEKYCAPVAMQDSSLKDVLGRLDERAPEGQAEQPETVHGNIFPAPLKSVAGGSPDDLSWSGLFPGMQGCRLELACPTSTARFLRAEPGVSSPHHSHGGLELTLVLDGAFSDETGDYQRGDLVITDEELDHTPTACPERGCLCLVVTSAPIRLKGWKALLNPFLRR